ncbi:MAG TPA: hypothetical protein G4O03_00470 [Dehalococcoidia bacterium]|jgi:hypothetical protein|nr:hypothetical protein [Dehalococcoidia bacterium]
MDKPGIHLIEAARLKDESFDRRLSIVRFIQLLHQRFIETERVKIEGLDYMLYHYPSLGTELRKALQDAENFLFNRKAELIFAVDKLTYGERPKLVYKGSEIQAHSIFGMLVPEAPGHLYTERV